MNGINLVPQQLQRVDLTAATGAQGTRLSVTAVVDAITGGDGLANVGHIAAAGLDLRTVTIDGDLGKIEAGDANDLTPGLASLRVASLGALGTSTQPGGGGNLNTDIRGPVGGLFVRGDVIDASLFFHGDPTNFNHPGGFVARVVIGGDLKGGGATDSGRLFATGGIGRVHIGGDLVGGNGSFSGAIASNSFQKGIEAIFIGGDIVGGGGIDAGNINSNGRLGSLFVGRSLLGGTEQSTARVHSGTAMGTVEIMGDLVGGTGPNSASVQCSGNRVSSVFVGGSVLGGAGLASATLSSGGHYDSLEIVGDLAGGTGEDSGRLFVSRRLGQLHIGGDLRTGTGAGSGNIKVGADIGSLEIDGSLVGTSANRALITARGMTRPGRTRDLAIGSLSVGGSVEFASVLAGYDTLVRPVNGDASIGNVEVGGDWVASNLVAGAAAGTDGLFGTADDTRIRPSSRTSAWPASGALSSAGPSRGRSPRSTTSASSPSWSARCPSAARPWP